MINRFQYILFFFIFILFTSCKNDPNDNLEYLEGYWEIKEAETPHNKTHKTYKFNETIDFISLDGKIGKRKKVKPTIDGKYKVTKNNESFQIDNSGDTLKLKYKTKYDEWEEYVIELSNDKLVILNEEKFRYTYKRYSDNIKFDEKQKK